MKKVLAGALITLTIVLVYRSCREQNEVEKQLVEDTSLLQKEIENVAKLIVTEGHFAQVYSYADSKELFGVLLTADKKALVVVNAEVQVVYDLTTIQFEMDAESKTVVVKNLPEPEVKIYPDFEYYDISADYFNPFEASDYNTIKKTVNNAILQKVKASSLLTNAENRMVTELSQFLVITRSLGWKLVYNKAPVTDPKILERLMD
ncbi:MAG: DUF4230 domain-containing protein [Bacteroidota bacterium]